MGTSEVLYSRKVGYAVGFSVLKRACFTLFCVSLSTLQGYGKGKRNNAQQIEKSAKERSTGNINPNHILIFKLK